LLRADCCRGKLFVCDRCLETALQDIMKILSAIAAWPSEYL
jgi:hypothetical protein